MTRQSLNQHIMRTKERHKTWRAFSDSVGVDFRILEGIARDRRNPTTQELARLGIIETTVQSFRFRAER